MKKLFSIVFLCTCMTALVGCNKTNESIISGCYQMSISSEFESNIPKISFDTKENTFVFTMDMLSSYIGCGNFTINDNTITAVTYDEEPNVYIFEIIDENNLSFTAIQSSPLLIIDQSIAVPETDSISFTKIEE